MSTQSPDAQGEPKADEVRGELIRRVRDDTTQGGRVCESHYVGTLVDGRFESTIVVTDDETEHAIDLLEQADAAFITSVIGDECAGGQFVIDDADDRGALHETLMEGAWDELVPRREQMDDKPDVTDYDARERAVLAAGTHVQQQRNPLAQLLGGL